MLNNLLNNANLLEKGLDAVWKRQEAISGNISNIDTPGYKAKRVEFESMFKNAIQSMENGGGAGPDGQNRLIDVSELNPTVYEDNSTSMRMDGNNVNIDQEMASMAKNMIQYQALTFATSRELNQMKMIITEGK